MGLIKKAVITTGVLAASYIAYETISEEIFKTTFLPRKYSYIVKAEEKEWLNNSNVLQVNINSLDGYKLCAYNIHNHDNHKYIIMLHGIWADKSSNHYRAMHFDKLGYNLLLVDQRGCGQSEGDYITYGQKESLDLVQWIDYLVTKDPEVEICLYGVSLGAVTVMMSLANDISKNVKCVVEDSGFSTLKEELNHYIETTYNIPFSSVVTSLIETKMKDNLGITFDDVVPKNCLDENEIPILFIHGKKDGLVPFEMSKVLYNHNKGLKKYYPIEDADHCEGISDANYFINVHNFISQFM